MKHSLIPRPRAHPAILALLTLAVCLPALADEEELRKEIEELKKVLKSLEMRLDVQEQKPIPQPPTAPSDPAADIDREFMDAEPTRAKNWYERTSFGGYGEMHLNLGNSDEIDFHRWVLFLNHDFTDTIRLVSELELEHSIAGEGANGEIELEQAYLEFDLGKNYQGRGGLFLMPVGILNETHEPTTFFGTERNPIEREIIPTTWWEGGLGFNQNLEQGIRWDVAFHSGLAVPSTGGNAYRIRSGRQKVSEADASEWASTARVRYTGIPGFEVGSSIQYQRDITPEINERNDAFLGEAHIDINKAGFGLRALAGYWNIDGPTPATLGLDEQWGYYVEPSYTFDIGQRSKLGFFGRYNQFDAAAGDFRQYDAGANFWPIDRIVFKADYSYIDNRDGDSEDVYNLGIGYVF